MPFYFPRNCNRMKRDASIRNSGQSLNNGHVPSNIGMLLVDNQPHTWRKLGLCSSGSDCLSAPFCGSGHQ